MDIAIVAPCPIPYMIGGAENLWRGLQDHLNEHTSASGRADQAAEPRARVLGSHRLLPALRRARPHGLRPRGVVQVPGLDGPAIRAMSSTCCTACAGLYDTYDVMHLPPDYPDPPPAVIELRAFMEENAGAARFVARVLRARGGAARRARRARGPVRVPGPVHPRARALPRRRRARRPTRSPATARSRPRWPGATATSRPAPTCSSRTRRPGSPGSGRTRAGAGCSPPRGSTTRSASTC